MSLDSLSLLLKEDSYSRMSLLLQFSPLKMEYDKKQRVVAMDWMRIQNRLVSNNKIFEMKYQKMKCSMGCANGG